jgi:glycosyltransferase involved in cell wall biosynthesis
LKKVLFVIDNLKIGGAEKVFVDLVNLCHDKINFDVLLITDFKGSNFQIVDKVNVIKLNRENKFSIRKALQLRRILCDYAIAHIHMRHTYKYLSYIRLIFRIPIRFIFHDHYGKINIDNSAPFFASKFLKPDIYIGVCNELCEWAINVWKIDKTKVHFFNNLPSRELLSWNSDKIPLGDFELVMVGNIKEVKNQQFALQISNLSNKRIAFIGQNQDDQYYKELESSLGRNKIVTDCNDPKQILTQFKLGLFTSKSESGPLVLLEYLLCGLPFISYRTGGISEILNKYFPDFFIDSFDEKDWSIRINYLLENPPVIDKIMVRKILDNEFNVDTYLNRLLNLYA